jgi:hypothetical protein
MARETATLASPPPKVAQAGGLEETLMTRRLQTQHDFTEGDKFFSHGFLQFVCMKRLQFPIIGVSFGMSIFETMFH